MEATVALSSIFDKGNVSLINRVHYIAFALFLVGGRALNLRPRPSFFDMIKQPARSLMTALTAVYTQLFDKCLIIKHAFQKSSPTVNNNAGQRLNLRDVYKVMEMRDCPGTSGHPSPS